MGEMLTTGEFDARNAERSRAACRAMAERSDTGKRVLTERERRILDMWPRFEDGEIAWFGDAYIDTDGDRNEVKGVLFDGDCADLVGLEGFHTGFESGDRVGRPAEGGLDADGMECLVGDAVWWAAEPAGNFTVVRIEPDGQCVIRDVGACATLCMIVPSSELTHVRPDSWERLEEDAEEIARDIALHFGDWSPSDFKGTGDSLQDRVTDIARRARALAGAPDED